MTLKELVDLARRASPGVAPDIDDAQALSLLRAVCGELLADIGADGARVLDVPVLGCFRIEPPAEGQAGGAARITFLPGGEKT